LATHIHREGKLDSKKKMLRLLTLSYARYVSRAHTIFSSWISLLIALTFGFFGVYFTIAQYYEIKPDPYKTMLLVETILIMAGIISAVAFYFISDSRLQRKRIVYKIKSIDSD